MARVTRVVLDTTLMDQIIANDQKRDLWIRGIAHQMLGDIVISMAESPPSGKSYPRGSRSHTASSPGNPPRIDVSTLVNSLGVRKIRAKAYAIEDGVEYGVKLELGIGVAARPFMRPVFINWAKMIGRAAQRGQLV